MKRQIQIPTHYANGEPTRWPELILTGLLRNGLDGEIPKSIEDHPIMHTILLWNTFGFPLPDKIHHIVPTDFECNPGDDIEFLAVTPDGEKFKFAPYVKCTGVYPISIDRKEDRNGWFMGISLLNLKTKTLRNEQFKEFLLNEGFDSYDEFCEVYPTPKYKGLIHWTDKRY
ncbi:hypothetical protein [Phaeocystidibacter marisrubri]|uniref:Uncharacterized protein n=1 Tax=Phaeocystidibacter marisrubri TaxID=1577780 RepID=A0A6L3ZBK9_9FLAO|nr:hypothetical protein [Phaeocystidibacter marisrubri]KAB2815011.1 hypothetical protein F8C82_14610 [Phaeocystidibacter marisrubri]GGH78037.1 hypothetical protein GCM10011318_28710 [Phaeocystidibacter marisrubri]